MLEQGDIALAVDPDEDDEDAEDDEIRATDSLLVVAITEDEYSHLEVHIYFRIIIHQKMTSL